MGKEDKEKQGCWKGVLLYYRGNLGKAMLIQQKISGDLEDIRQPVMHISRQRKQHIKEHVKSSMRGMRKA